MLEKFIKDFSIGGAGIVTNLAVSVSLEQVSAWVSIITSVAIALVTCGIQIYRMIRDRDEDKNKEK